MGVILTPPEEKLLLACTLFSGMKEEPLGQSLHLLQAERAEARRGDILIRLGDTMRRFGLVLSGHIEVFTEDFNGRHMIMASVSRGGLFGEALAFLTAKEVPLYIRATEPSQILWMNPEALPTDETPLGRELTHRYTVLLCEKLLSMNDRVQVLSKYSIRDKLMTYLSQCAHKSGGDSFTLPFGREALADYLGVNRSALCREISAMAADGLIEVQGRKITVIHGEEEIP